MPLLDRTGWRDDSYVRADTVTDAPVLLVPLAAVAEGVPPGVRVGVEIDNDVDVAALVPLLGAVDLIAVRFPKFNDGRGFSIARQLRRAGFAGTLRAVGPLIPDQFAFALRCGFDEVEIGEAQAARQPIDQWLHALTLIDVSYQDGGDGLVSILERRRAARVAA